MSKVLGLGTLFIIGLMFADALTHPNGVQAVGQTTNGLMATGGNQLLGVSSSYKPNYNNGA
jgi:hypothetical protein